MTQAARLQGIARPRLGFLGVGWIGRHRMQAIAESGGAEIACICDPSAETRAEAAKLAPGAVLGDCLEDILARQPDGIVIATPSALHAEQAIAALDAGIAVFCQKPLGRTAAEAEAVIAAARSAGRLLGVDLSYRHTEAMQHIRSEVRRGSAGEIFAADLVFHNAYGPDKPWFYDKSLSGGGCVIDLGVHLIDLALWTLDFPRVVKVSGHVRAGGQPLVASAATVEDYGVATLELETGAVLRIACSWNLAAGRDAVIGAEFYGTKGGLRMRNLDGSFFDFAACRLNGTVSEPLCGPPDDWGGRAATAWARQLARGNRYDPAIEHVLETARVIDAIYGG